MSFSLGPLSPLDPRGHQNWVCISHLCGPGQDSSGPDLALEPVGQPVGTKWQVPPQIHQTLTPLCFPGYETRLVGEAGTETRGALGKVFITSNDLMSTAAS